MYRITSLLFFIPFLCFSQVGVNTTTPHPSSILDITSSDKGLLIPRVILSGTDDLTTISSPAKSLLVYNERSNKFPEGFYFWDGAQWEPLKSEKAWLLDGNKIEDSNHALGTTNERPLLFKTNNKLVANLHPSGGISVGLEALASPFNGIAIGNSARASSQNNLAIGVFSLASGDNSFALGTYAEASGQFGTAIGTEAEATGKNATALGHLSKAVGSETLAIGGGARAESLSAVALGPYAEATAIKSFALGPNTKATAENSFALGIGAVAEMPNTVIIGEVKTGNMDVTPVNVGIGTKDPKARLDVHGKFKLGEKGNVLKGINGFSAEVDGTNSISPNHSGIAIFQIPEINQPSSTQAVIGFTLDPDASDVLSIAWVKFSGTNTIRVKFWNNSGTLIDLDGLAMNFTITEF